MKTNKHDMLLSAWTKPDVIIGTVESAKNNKDMKAVEKAILSKRIKKVKKWIKY